MRISICICIIYYVLFVYLIFLISSINTYLLIMEFRLSSLFYPIEAKTFELTSDLSLDSAVFFFFSAILGLNHEDG